MFKQLADGIVGFLLKQNVVSEEEKPIYIYGCELIISSIFGILLILVAGVLTNRILESVCYLLCLIPLRQLTGGYHADSYFRCNLIFILCYIGVCSLSYFSESLIIRIILFIMMVISWFIIKKYAPIDSEKKRIDSENRDYLNRKSQVLCLIIIMVALAGSFVSLRLYTICASTLSIVAGAVLITFIQRRSSL